MKGIELSKAFYLEFGKQLIHERFPELEKKIVIGLIGAGSECYGYDDEISYDHDFGPDFCMFVPSSFDEKTIFQLEHLYNEFPNEFKGFKRKKLIPGESSHRGVIKIDDFFYDKLGCKDGLSNLMDWFYIPSFYLLEATNGEIFRDDEGIFSSIRNKHLTYPEDVRLKKLAGEILLMYQSGIYNYERCMLRHDIGAAQLCVIEFVKHTISVVYLLNNKYMPYYKWIFRGMKELTILSDIQEDLIFLISSNNDNYLNKLSLIQDISFKIINEIVNQNLSIVKSYALDAHAISINNHIKDENIRNLHILFGTK